MKSFIRYLQGERRGLSAGISRDYSTAISIPLNVMLADVSFYQGDIDFYKMKSAGLSGVIIRAGQRYWIDTEFESNWFMAKEAGLPRGSYWFYDSREDPKKQAALWWSLVQDDIGELFHVADLEDNYGGAYANAASYKTFIDEFKRLSGLPNNKIVVYTGYYWWGDHVGDNSYFSQYRLWLAWYGSMDVVNIPKPWTQNNLVLWQYTSSGDGTYYGVTSKEIDLNYYNGTKERFLAEYQEAQDMYYKGTVTATSLRVRSSTNTTSDNNIISRLVDGDKVEAGSVTAGWWKLLKKNGASFSGYAYEGVNKEYIRTDEVIPDTVPSLDDIREALKVITQNQGLMISKLDGITADIAELASETPTTPPVVSDGYTGKNLGIYRIKPVTGATSFQPFDGDGGYITIMQDRTADWMAANCPGWANFINPAGEVKPSVYLQNGHWYIVSKAIYGQLVRVAEIVSGRARIVGMDADGDPKFAAVNLDACSPTGTPHYFHKIPNVPRYFPMIQPRGKDAGGYPQAWWIEASMLEKV
jgi:lysozyme